MRTPRPSRGGTKPALAALTIGAVIALVATRPSAHIATTVGALIGGWALAHLCHTPPAGQSSPAYEAEQHRRAAEDCRQSAAQYQAAQAGNLGLRRRLLSDAEDREARAEEELEQAKTLMYREFEAEKSGLFSDWYKRGVLDERAGLVRPALSDNTPVAPLIVLADHRRQADDPPARGAGAGS